MTKQARVGERLLDHPELGIQAQAIHLVVSDCDRIRGPQTRMIIRAVERRMLRPLTGRGQLCHYLVAAEGVEAPHSFGQLRARYDDEVGAEELHEPVVLGALLLSCAGELVRITKCPLRVAHRHLAGGAMDRDTVTLRITREVAA